MTVIDLGAAVAAALRADDHYPACVQPGCVFCTELTARVEAMVMAAAPLIANAVRTTRPDAEDGLRVRQQWAARLPGGRIRERDTENQARAMAHAWGGELLVQEVYSGAGEFRVVEDFSQVWKARSHG